MIVMEKKDMKFMLDKDKRIRAIDIQIASLMAERKELDSEVNTNDVKIVDSIPQKELTQVAKLIKGLWCVHTISCPLLVTFDEFDYEDNNFNDVTIDEDSVYDSPEYKKLIKESKSKWLKIKEKLSILTDKYNILDVDVLWDRLNRMG